MTLLRHKDVHVIHVLMIYFILLQAQDLFEFEEQSGRQSRVSWRSGREDMMADEMRYMHEPAGGQLLHYK